MTCFVTTLFILVFGMAPGAMAEEYGWSLSGSATDPNVNTAPATAPGEPFQVYLWLNCTAFDGMMAAEFSLQSNFFNAGFTPMGGALNAGDSVDLLLAVGGCPRAPYLMGAWSFQDLTAFGGTACLVASPRGTNGSVECDRYDVIHANAIVGFTTGGLAPCAVGTCEDPVSIEDASWGSIKGLYQ